MVHLLSSNILICIFFGCLTLELKLLLILHLLHQLDFILITQSINILLLKLVYFYCLLNLSLFSELWIKIVFSLTSNESCHVLFHERLLDNFDDTRSCFIILNQ